MERVEPVLAPFIVLTPVGMAVVFATVTVVLDDATTSGVDATVTNGDAANILAVGAIISSDATAIATRSTTILTDSTTIAPRHATHFIDGAVFLPHRVVFPGDSTSNAIAHAIIVARIT